MPPVHAWPMDQLEWARDTITLLGQAFQPAPYPHQQKLADISDAQLCKIHALLLYLIADLLEAHQIDDTADLNVFARLAKSIEYMDRNYLDSPALQDVAAQSHLAPNYFHRLFSSTFGVSPFNYMLTRRMNLAKQLLSSSAHTVREVAADCGYSSEFYFSKTFKKHFGTSPSAYRAEVAKA
jgi:AraC-like DNA-binding protein